MSINIIWGPPGSGKTTLSTDLLNSYSKNNKNVCLISPDVHSTVSARLGITIPEDKSLNGCLSSDKKTIDALYSLGQGKYLLAWPTGNDAFNNVLCLNDAKRIISQLSSVMDGIIIDGAPQLVVRGEISFPTVFSKAGFESFSHEFEIRSSTIDLE